MDKLITFLCDSGADKIVVNDPWFSDKLSNDFVWDRSANGLMSKEFLTYNMFVKDDLTGRSTKTQHLYSSSCPVNLLSRQTMCELSLALLPTLKGLIVKQVNNGEDVFVMEGRGQPQYFYTLDLCASAVSDIPRTLIEMADARATPVQITPKTSFRPCVKQYPLKRDAEEGISDTIDALVKAGVIVPCPDSPVNTPLFPVKKAAIPVHPDSQFWFAFMYKRKKWTFTHLAQSYCESPTIFSQWMSSNLAKFSPLCVSKLLLYVDDILLASPTEKACQIDMKALLKFLADNGHKVNKSERSFWLSHGASIVDGIYFSPEKKKKTISLEIYIDGRVF
uniref:ribonuclease H n=1 Tax=Myripristis murdjan TaxID=586833 RepID=A0A667Z8M7_9TELE